KAKKSVRLMMEKLFGMELELILFWSTAMAKTINGEEHIHSRVYGKEIVITESSVRRDLRLADEEDKAVHKERGDRLVRAATTASSIKVEQDSGNMNKTQSKATPNESSSLGTTSGGGPKCQKSMGDTIAQTRFERVSKLSNDSPLVRGNTLQSDEDRIKLEELMVLCTNLQNRVLHLEKIKTSQHKEIVSLKKRDKKLEKKQCLGEDASKQGRRIDAIDADKDITLVNVQDDAEMFDVNDLGVTTEEITLAQALVEIKTSKPKVKGIVLQEPGESTTTTTISSKQSQDKGKGIMVEEPVKPKKKDLIRLDEEAAKRLQAEFDEEERLAREKAKKEQEANISLIKEWDDIQAKIDIDYQLAERMQAQEQEELSMEEKSTLFQQLLEKRRKHFAAKRAEEKRNKPPIKHLEGTKKQKVDDDKETAELKQFMEVILDEEEVAINAMPLAVKSPKIIDWKIHKEGKKSHYQIVRANRKS
ncbi:hypothetical protein Tco_1036074, partial [Tanacetum coccineum]